MHKNSDKILVGKIVAPQGLRGDVRVQTFTTSPEDLQTLKIENLDFKFLRSVSHDIAIIKIAGIDDRNSAETLRGTELFVARDSLPQLSDGEYYHADLIGLSVIKNDIKIGIVTALHNFGAGDILELDSGKMLSFKGAEVDMNKKEIKI